MKNLYAPALEKEDIRRHILYISALFELEGRKKICSMTVDVIEHKEALDDFKRNES